MSTPVADATHGLSRQGLEPLHLDGEPLWKLRDLAAEYEAMKRELASCLGEDPSWASAHARLDFAKGALAEFTADLVLAVEPDNNARILELLARLRQAFPCGQHTVSATTPSFDIEVECPRGCGRDVEVEYSDRTGEMKHGGYCACQSRPFTETECLLIREEVLEHLGRQFDRAMEARLT